MTEETNELASAYVDGEATPQEATLIEQNDQAQPLIADLRRLSGRIQNVEPVDAEVRERHIGTALQAFNLNFSEAITLTIEKPPKSNDSGATVANVVPLRTPATATAPPSHVRQAGGAHAGDTRSADPRKKSRYRWTTPLASAAVFTLVVGAGVGLFLTSQQDTFTTSEDSAFEPAQDAAENTTVEASPIEAEATPRTESADLDNAADSQDEGGSDESAGAAASPADASGLVKERLGSQAQAAPVEAELLAFQELPSKSQLESIVNQTKLSTDYRSSLCATSIDDPADGQLLGYLPISLNGERGEMIVFKSTTKSSGLTILTVDAACAPF